MAWDGKKLPDALAAAATNAANDAISGSKNAAYLTYIRDQIGANFLMKLLREDVVVWQATATGSLTISGSRFVLPTSVTQTSITASDIDTGEWILRVENASDATVYIATAVTTTAGAGPFRLSADLATSGSVILGSLLLNSPTFDTVAISGLNASSITSSAAALSIVVSGAIPAGAQMQIQVTTNPATGPWLESTKPPAAPGTFTHTFTNLASNLLHYYRAFVYTEVGNGQPAIIHASSETATFTTQAGSAPVTGDVDTMMLHMAINDTSVVLNNPPDRNGMKGGNVIVGGDVRAAAVPNWWDGAQYRPPIYTATYWPTLQPWYVVWDMVGHQDNLNVVCALRDIELWWLSEDTNAWSRLSIASVPQGSAFARDEVTSGGNATGVLGSDGTWWVKISPTGSIYHGFRGQVSVPSFDPAKILALQTRIKARKQIENPSLPDQRSLAKYSIKVGLDPYPGVGAPLPSDGYWPGAMSSRHEEVTNDWKTIFATTVTPAFAIDNNSRASGGYSSRQKITEAALRANPPPVA